MGNDSEVHRKAAIYFTLCQPEINRAKFNMRNLHSSIQMTVVRINITITP